MNIESFFKIEDINILIKLFAFSIQERFEEIDGASKNNESYHPSFDHVQELIEESEHLIRKYRGYLTVDEREKKYLERLVVRILQILEFFKERCKSFGVLEPVIKKIYDKLNTIIASSSIDVQHLFTYIVELAKNGFSLKKPNPRERRSSMKKMEPEKGSEKIETKAFKKSFNPSDQQKEPKSGDLNQKRRPLSVSLKSTIKLIPSRSNIETEIAKLYSIMDVDIGHLQRNIVDSKDKTKIEKECLRQNGSILTAIQNYDKQYFENAKKKCKNECPLKEVNNRSVAGRPVFNNWISRKKKMTELKKKRSDSENISIY